MLDESNPPDQAVDPLDLLNFMLIIHAGTIDYRMHQLERLRALAVWDTLSIDDQWVIDEAITAAELVDLDDDKATQEVVTEIDRAVALLNERGIALPEADDD